MGSFSSKAIKEEMECTPSRPYTFKRIEDPRSPTEEISRTPIEVAEKSNDVRNCSRVNALKQQNMNADQKCSPRTWKAEQELKKVNYNFVEAIESEPIIEMEVTNTSVSETESKENIA